MLYYTHRNANKCIMLEFNNREIIDELKSDFFKYQSILYYSISILITLFGILGIFNVVHLKSAYLAILIYAIPSLLLRKYTKKHIK